MTETPSDLSLQDQTDEALQVERAQVEQHLTALRLRYAQLSEEIHSWAKRAQALDEETDQRRLKAVLAAPAVDWPFLLAVNAYGNTSQARFKASNEAVAALARVSDHSALSLSGYFPETQQRCVQLGLVGDNDLVTEVALKGLEQLLPHLKAVELPRLQRKAVVIKVFESTLSENGSYQLLIDPSLNSFSLERVRYGSPHVLVTADNLGDVLNYVQKHHPYTSSLTAQDD